MQDLAGHELSAEMRAPAALQAPFEQCSLFCVATRLRHENLSQKAFLAPTAGFGKLGNISG